MPARTAAPKFGRKQTADALYDISIKLGELFDNVTVPGVPLTDAQLKCIGQIHVATQMVVGAWTNAPRLERYADILDDVTDKFGKAVAATKVRA